MNRTVYQVKRKRTFSYRCIFYWGVRLGQTTTYSNGASGRDVRRYSGGDALEYEGKYAFCLFLQRPDKRELEKIGAELVGGGYRLVEIREHESDIPEEVLEWQLHVERVESQTVDTLYARNIQLADLAGRYNDLIYDGMDVGPIEGE